MCKKSIAKKLPNKAYCLFKISECHYPVYKSAEHAMNTFLREIQNFKDKQKTIVNTKQK